MKSPGTKTLVDEIVHNTFVREGTMVAFPTCFPGASKPITPDESHITALDIAEKNTVYGGTSGRGVHLFAAMFQGVTGIVFDLGVVANANHCAAVCVGKTHMLACVNGTQGGRIVSTRLQALPFDLIQEWGFSRRPFKEVGQPDDHQPILHAVADPAKKQIVGMTKDTLFKVNFDKPKITTIDHIKGAGSLAVDSQGNVFGLDEDSHLWRYHVGSGTLTRKAVELPAGAWDQGKFCWAHDTQSGLLYLTDDEGRLFSFSEKNGFAGPLGQTMLAPVRPMAVTFDGRVFGFCGPEISNMFCYDPNRKTLVDLGAAVSVIQRRRYGYYFGAAVTGRDGQIFFGEDDDMGHLWLYFPRIAAANIQ